MTAMKDLSAALAVSRSTTYDFGHAASSKRVTEVSGKTTRIELDGFGREVCHVAVNRTGGGGEFEIWSADYDVLGRMRMQTTTDTDVPLVEDGHIVKRASVSLSTRYRYDGWGNILEEIRPDGVTVHRRVDPVRRIDETWEASTGETGTVTRTTSNVTGKPVTVERLHVDGTVRASAHYEYDAFDRCSAEILSGEGIETTTTRHRYDAYDRLVESTLPDGAVVTRSYPAYTAEPLVQGIAIRHDSLGEESVPLGARTFDGLGRCRSSTVGARTITYRYVDPLSCEPDFIDLPGGTSMSCAYEKNLADRLMSVSFADQEMKFTRDDPEGKVTFAENALGSVASTYSSCGWLETETTTLDGTARKTTHAYSLLGKKTMEVGPDGQVKTFGYDKVGRLAAVNEPGLTFSMTYDGFSRPETLSSATSDGARSMHLTLGYDGSSREIRRNIVARIGKRTWSRVLHQDYSADDKLSLRRTTGEDGQREERYGYDLRRRLKTYTCSGEGGPVDEARRPIREQAFVFDALNNITGVTTYYVDPFEPETIDLFRYDMPDRTQLLEWSRQRGGILARRVSFTYDAFGNMQQDHDNREWIYDAMGRCCGWSGESGVASYRYDAFDRLGSVTEPSGTRYRYYNGGRLAREEEAEGVSAFHVVGGRVLAETRLAQATRKAILLSGDVQGSTICEVDEALSKHAYMPYGDVTGDALSSCIGFSGEVRDRATGCYFLDDYRVYSPTLMRFFSPDAAAPFGKGGLNPYVYCGGDPVNHVDPTGQSLFSWILAGVMFVAGVVATYASWGTLGPAFGAVWSTITGSAAAGATPVAAGVTATASSIAATNTAVTAAASASLAQWGEAIVGTVGALTPVLDITSAGLEGVGKDDLANVLGGVSAALSFATGMLEMKWAIGAVVRRSHPEFGVGARWRAMDDQMKKRQVVDQWQRSPLASISQKRWSDASVSSAAYKWLARTRGAKLERSQSISAAASRRADDPVSSAIGRVRSPSLPDRTQSPTPSTGSNVFSTEPNTAGVPLPEAMSVNPFFAAFTSSGSAGPSSRTVDLPMRHLRRVSFSDVD